mgnify:CR=1 FL=1
MKSRVGSILTLIGAIFTFVVAGVILLMMIFFGGLLGLSDKLGNGIRLELVMGIFAGLFVLFLIGGILKIYASRLMMDKKKVVRGGIMAIILGLFVSDIFSLIGGIIAVVQGNK